MHTHLLNGLCLLTGACAAASTVVAAPVEYRSSSVVFYYQAKSGNWANASAWKGGKVPVDGAYGNLPDNAVVLDSKVPEAGAVALGGENKAATLTIASGGELPVSGIVWVPVGSRKNATGTLVMTGGKLQSGLNAESARGLYIGTGVTYSGTGVVTMSGGSYTGGFKIGSPNVGTQTGTLAVVGANAQIASPGEKHNLRVMPSGNIVFYTDAKGVACMDYAKSDVVLEKGSHVIADGSRYKGGSQTLTLVTAGRLTDEGAVLETRNFPPVYNVELYVKQEKPTGLFLKIIQQKQ